MYTCRYCTYALTITKNTTALQENIIAITDPNEYVKMFVNRKKKTDKSGNNAMNVDSAVELNFELNALILQLQKSNIKEDMAATIIEKYNIIKKNTRPNTFCLKCTKCNEIFILPPGIISTIKIKRTATIGAVENPEEIVTDLTLERTKNFICTNKQCEENTAPIDKEAVYYRPNPEEFVTKLICVNCYSII
jgi:hypothetical protein